MLVGEGAELDTQAALLTAVREMFGSLNKSESSDRKGAPPLDLGSQVFVEEIRCPV